LDAIAQQDPQHQGEQHFTAQHSPQQFLEQQFLLSNFPLRACNGITLLNLPSDFQVLNSLCYPALSF